MAVTIPFAWFWMQGSQFQDYSQSLIAVSLFASNMLFARESGYFSPDADQFPLLHTWSLAVEEQYYMLFPLFLIVVWRFGPRKVLYSLIAAAVVSFGLSEWGARNIPNANFYLAPSRAWELLVGAIAGLYLTRHVVRPSTALSMIGLGMILLAVMVFDDSTRFPSVFALLPVGGTALIILFGGSGTLTARLLSLRWVVNIGLVSYSAYLWHQPLFAFARIRSVPPPEVSVMPALIIASFLLAWFNWRFIENPIRSRRFHISRSRLFSVAGVFAGSLVLVGAAGNMGLANLHLTPPPNVEFASMSHRVALEGEICNREESRSYPAVQMCDFGAPSSDYKIGLWGTATRWRSATTCATHSRRAGSAARTSPSAAVRRFRRCSGQGRARMRPAPVVSRPCWSSCQTRSTR
jgi:peptidoglycan/LPS O-acetylase OafA/YrhL